jgi:hypothetical protein
MRDPRLVGTEAFRLRASSLPSLVICPMRAFLQLQGMLEDAGSLLVASIRRGEVSFGPGFHCIVTCPAWGLQRWEEPMLGHLGITSSRIAKK